MGQETVIVVASYGTDGKRAPQNPPQMHLGETKRRRNLNLKQHLVFNSLSGFLGSPLKYDANTTSDPQSPVLLPRTSQDQRPPGPQMPSLGYVLWFLKLQYPRSKERKPQGRKRLRFYGSLAETPSRRRIAQFSDVKTHLRPFHKPEIPSCVQNNQYGVVPVKESNNRTPLFTHLCLKNICMAQRHQKRLTVELSIMCRQKSLLLLHILQAYLRTIRHERYMNDSCGFFMLFVGSEWRLPGVLFASKGKSHCLTTLPRGYTAL